MNKIEFEQVFENIFSKTMTEMGFTKTGSHFYINRGFFTVSLIRLGGHLAYPGSVSYVFCFRHTFLPNLDGKIISNFEKEVFAYPIKIKPSEIFVFLNKPFRYQSQNLSYEYDTINYAELNAKSVVEMFDGILKGVSSYLNWAAEQPIEMFCDSIEKDGEGAWIEKIWIEAYKSKLK